MKQELFSDDEDNCRTNDLLAEVQEWVGGLQDGLAAVQRRRTERGVLPGNQGVSGDGEGSEPAGRRGGGSRVWSFPVFSVKSGRVGVQQRAGVFSLPR